MRLLLGTCLALGLVTPAHAQWSAVQWDMTVADAVAAGGEGFAEAKDSKDQRIYDQRRLATGTEVVGDIAYELDLYFDRKAKTLTMIKVEPVDKAHCEAMLDAYQQSLGPLEIEDKTRNFGDNAPNVYTRNGDWAQTPRGGLARFSQVSIESSEYRHCQILFQKQDYREE